MAVEQQPGLPPASPEEKLSTGSLSSEDIVNILGSYFNEADHARKTGHMAREDVWRNNVDLYWSNFDYSSKAAWQTKEAMPEAPMFVDRWSAAMREALIASGEWYMVEDPSDTEGDLANIIKRFTDLWLGRCGRTSTGQHLDFSALFEELMKLAAMMAATVSVTWQRDQDDFGYVAVQPVEPFEVYLDPTGRGLYRIRVYEIDHFRLHEMAALEDGTGDKIFDVEAINKLSAQLVEEHRLERQRLTSHGQDVSTFRKPVKIAEYLCTLLDNEGKKVGDNLLCVVANDRHLIRGPEKNPFAHGRDWIVHTPAITVPMSVYGRTYMENWSSVARTFIEMTNIIVDATRIISMKAFAVVEDMLEDPSELDEGLCSGKILRLEAGGDAKRAIEAIDLGTLSNSSVTVWQALKEELREGAAFNEIALGQLPDKSALTATEVSETQQSSAALLRSIARTIEARLLEPLLNLVWKTGLQHLTAEDDDVRRALGDDVFAMLLERKDDFLHRRITFRARGLSGIIARGQKLRNLLQALQVFGANEVLAAAFFQRVGPDKFVDEVLRLSGIDVSTLTPTPREQQIAAMTQQPQQTEPQGSPPAPTGENVAGGLI